MTTKAQAALVTALARGAKLAARITKHGTIGDFYIVKDGSIVTRRTLAAICLAGPTVRTESRGNAAAARWGKKAAK